MTELLGAVESPTHDKAFMSAEGIAPREGKLMEGKCESGEKLCQGLL